MTPDGSARDPQAASPAPAPLEVKTPLNFDGKLAIYLLHSPELELEPCGCSYHPLGGLQRTYYFTQTLAPRPADGFFLVSGISLFPSSEPRSQKITPLLLKGWDHKADTVINAYNTLNVTAMQVDSADTLLGLDRLKKLQKAAKFPFISSNLVDLKTKKPLFKTHLILTKDKTRVLLLAVSTKPSIDKFNKQYAGVTPADQAIKKIMTAEKGKFDIVAVMSVLTPVEIAALSKKVPQVNLFLGAGNLDNYHLFDYFNPSTLLISPIHLGRSVVQIAIQNKGPFKQWFLGEEAKGRLEGIERNEKLMKDLDSQIAKETDAKKKKQFEVQKKSLEDSNKKVATQLILKETPDTTSIRYENYPLNLTYDVSATPPDPMSAVLQKHKEKIRQAGITEESH